MTQTKRYACIGDPAQGVNAPLCFAVGTYPVETEPSVFEKQRISGGVTRNVLRLTLEADFAAVKAAFTDGTAWYLACVTTTDGDDDTAEVVCYDKSAFCLAGDLVDHRSGCVTVYMAQKTAEELERESLEAENARLLFENLTGGTY